MQECNRCNSEVDRPIIEHLSGNPYCDPCAELLLFPSDFGGEYYPREGRVILRYGRRNQWTKMVHEAQECGVCAYCEEVEDQDSLRTCYYNGQHTHICDGCYEDNFFTCAGCSEVEENDYRYSPIRNNSSGEGYCSSCRDDHLTCCYGCDEYFWNDECSYSERDDEHYCDDCGDEEGTNRIHNYSYKPCLNFYDRNFEKKIYLGVELEVDGERSTADSVEGFPEDKYVFKDDSSTEGYEIVGHPMTIEHIKENEKWGEKMKELKKHNLTSYHGGNCGIHVHISKDQVKPIDAWKMVYFMDKCRQQVHKFTQRNSHQRDRWARYNTPEQMGMHNFSAITLKQSYPQNGERYAALNFLSQTIEFRVFRGTLDPTRFMATLEFVKVLSDFVCNVGFNHFKTREGEELWNNFYTYACKYYGGNSCLVKIMKKYELNRELVY